MVSLIQALTDFTPVCTTESVAFQKRSEAFEELGCKLIGLSVDQVFSHFPHGPVQMLCKLAGLLNPSGSNEI